VISLSPIKLLVVAAVIMLLMGPDKLPEMAHRLGSAWRALKRLQEKMEAEVREAIPDLPSTSDIARIPVSLLNQLADRVDAKEAAAAPETPIPPEPDGSTLFRPPRIATPPPVRSDAPTPPPDPSLN
jgi:TatA/E family protein of Tat protein translocase